MEIKVGETFGRLELVALVNGTARQNDKATFRCDCGVTKQIRVSHVVRGVTVSCGCVKRRHSVDVGQRAGRLTVVAGDLHRVGRKLKVMCRCDCGTEKLIGVPELAGGITQSCGCLVVEQISALSLKHGGEGSPLYTVWASMKNRCRNPKSDGYHRYGGRGISVAAEWFEFGVFREWAMANGYQRGLEIDRRDVNGNYEPSNCRWVTTMVNGNNRRNNVRLEAFGETKTMADWSRDPRCAVSYATLKQRIRKGAFSSDEAAISTPARG